MIDKAALAARLSDVQSRIDQAAEAAGRQASEITLVVVTKGYPSEALASLYELGVRNFGESYLAEALQKQAALSKLADSTWHMIGHVQSRKAEEVAGNFHWVHSVDSFKRANRLSKFAEAGRELPVLLEVNVGGEATKHGVPASDDAAFEAKLDEIGQILQLPNVHVRGLMSMAPMSAEGEQARPFFERTRKLRDRLAIRFPSGDWEHLSMGMSGDFEAAIMEGATMVRVGKAILGPRN